MTASTVVFNSVSIPVDLVSTSQASTDSTVAVTNSNIDARVFDSVSYTIKVATNAVTWSVWAANISDFSDEVAIQAPVSVAAGNVGSYSVSQAPFSYYRVKIVSTAGGQVGTATISGIAKG